MAISTERRTVTGLRALPRAARVRVREDARVIWVVWRREMLRFSRSRARMAISLAQPVLYLVLLGPGLARLIPASAAGADYRRFLFPGVLLMTVQFAAIVAGSSIAWDREGGFLREMLVAPARRGALLLGACVGGASMATAQAVVLLPFAGLAHVPYRWGPFAAVVAEMAVAALALTAFGALLGCLFRRIETFQVVLNLLMLPMFFLSGAMFPRAGMPAWARAVSTLDPVTWAVDALRRTVLAGGVDVDGMVFGREGVPVIVDLALLAAFTLLALAVARRRFAQVR